MTSNEEQKKTTKGDKHLKLCFSNEFASKESDISVSIGYRQQFMNKETGKTFPRDHTVSVSFFFIFIKERKSLKVYKEQTYQGWENSQSCLEGMLGKSELWGNGERTTQKGKKKNQRRRKTTIQGMKRKESGIYYWFLRYS